MKIAAAARRRVVVGVLACCLTGVTGMSAGEILPAEQRVDWTPGVAVGVPGGIPTDRRCRIDVTQPPYGADKTGAAVLANAELSDAFARCREHLRANGVNLDADRAVLGPWVALDPDGDRFTGPLAQQANDLSRREYRKACIVPELA